MISSLAFAKNLALQLRTGSRLVLARSISDKSGLPKEPFVVMSKNAKSIFCYHPEPEHPFNLTKPIERTVENSKFNSDMASLYAKRFDNRPPTSEREFNLDTMRLSREFMEHPGQFSMPNRQKRIKKLITSRINKNRESI